MNKNMTQKNKVIRKSDLIIFALITVLLVSMSTMFAFAAGEEISTAVTTVCKDIGGIMTAIINPICSVVIGICLITLIFGKNSKSADASIQWIKRVIICFVCFNCIGLFLSYGTSLMSGIGGQSNWG